MSKHANMNNTLQRETTMDNTNCGTRKAIELALQGNNHANSGDYLQAVNCFHNSIAIWPKEYSFYVNRALCYLKLDFLYLCLYDIDQAIELAPSNAKCYFIRSKVLKKLNEYELAESDLLTAAQLDPESDEIIEEMSLLRERGKERHLLKDKLSGYDLSDRVYNKIKANLHLVQAHNLPTNLWNYQGVRVENVHHSTRDETIRSHFSLFGDIKDIKRVHSKQLNVLIYYTNPVTPMFTIAYYQNRIVEELCARERSLFKPLKLYFAPTDSQGELKFSRPKRPLLSNQECYYWRTTSCNLNTRCPKLHIPANKNIDTQIWMREKS